VHHRTPPSTRRLSVGAALVLAVLVSGCERVTGMACTTEFVFGLRVTVVEEGTGDAVSEGLAGVAIRDGVPSEMEPVGNTLRGAGEEAGVFTVQVAAPGYEPWSRAGVEVVEGPCHVETVRLDAELVPAA